jgi:L-2-hydroxyglutarate oxidase LhgO
MDHFDLCIIGAGVAGLAVAEEFSATMPSSFSILLVEQNERFGQETSSRNSEVIHAGIYYPPGSLKAALCVEGRELLYAYCTRHSIAHRKLGKLIVSQEDEVGYLETLFRNAAANGVASLRWLSSVDVLAMEPLVKASAALYSPDSGIVDSHGLMLSLLNRAQAAGVLYAPRTRVLKMEASAKHFTIDAACGHGKDAEEYVFTAARVVNAAGLQACALAQRISGLDQCTVPAMQISKGNYFRYAAPAPFTHLVYPVPEKDQRGLGIHATVDLGGQVKFGPDVDLDSAQDYHVDPARRALFAEAIRRYFPSVQEASLVPDYAGLRPRLASPAGTVADFAIQDASVHRLPGLVQLYGIESPGLTASLAIAKHVRSRTDFL